MAVALAVWVAYAAFLYLRFEAGWRGRRTAYLAVSGIVLVAAALVPVAHF
jgi:ABC-type transport system involved in cytochrome c biogenesis permease subunit